MKAKHVFKELKTRALTYVSGYFLDIKSFSQKKVETVKNLTFPIRMG